MVALVAFFEHFEPLDKGRP